MLTEPRAHAKFFGLRLRQSSVNELRFFNFKFGVKDSSVNVTPRKIMCSLQT